MSPDLSCLKTLWVCEAKCQSTCDFFAVHPSLGGCAARSRETPNGKVTKSQPGLLSSWHRDPALQGLACRPAQRDSCVIPGLVPLQPPYWALGLTLARATL